MQRQDVIVTDIAGYVEAVTVRDQAAELLKAAKRIPTRPVSEAVRASSIDSLMHDAKLAWSYFDRLTDPGTGLVPATAWFSEGERPKLRFRDDVGHGQCHSGDDSAHSIDLIDTAEFQSRLTLLLSSLADQPFAGLNLPAGLSSTSGQRHQATNFMTRAIHHGF